VLGTQGLSAALTAADPGVMLARSQYRLRRVSLTDIPAAERRAALRNICLAWQPFDEVEYRVLLQSDGALLFAWDRRLRLQAEGARAWLPESCLREAQAHDGLRVLRLDEGTEAELWHQGELRASRWWPQPPAQDEAEQWLRSQGELGAGLGWLPAVDAPRAKRPIWSLLDLDGLTRSGGRVERLAALVIGLGLSGLAGAAGMQAWHSHQQLEAARQAAAAQRQAQAPVKASRDAAQKLIVDVAAAEQAFAQPSALQLLEHLAPLLKPGVELRELELKGQVLRLVVSWPGGLPRSTLLQDLQAGGWLRGAKELREGQGQPAGQMAVEAELDGLQPPPPKATQAASAPSGDGGAASGFPMPGVAR